MHLHLLMVFHFFSTPTQLCRSDVQIAGDVIVCNRAFQIREGI